MVYAGSMFPERCLVMSEIEQTIPRLVGEHAPKGRLLVAFSGGRDSSVLLHAVSRVCPGRECRALHVDHGLHERATVWAEHCREFAEGLGVPCRVLKVNVPLPPGESLEAAARHARYRVLAEQLRPGDWLLTAHHAGDQLETLLQRLLRGSGSLGLSGIRLQRPLGPGHILRPLLMVDEAEIQAYAEDHALRWVEDPSNRELRHDRNFLRHKVLPLLQARWPQAGRQAARAARHLAEEAAVLRELGEADLARVGEGEWISLQALGELSPARRRNLLRYWLTDEQGRGPGMEWLDRLQAEVIDARPDAAPVLAVGTRLVRRHGDRLYWIPRDQPEPEPGPFHWQAPARALVLPGNGRLQLRPDGAGRTVRLPDCVTVRYRQGGELFHDGRHSRRLKEWMRLAEIPPEKRDRLPLLLDGERLFAAGESVLDPAYIAEERGQNGARTGHLRWLEKD